MTVTVTLTLEVKEEAAGYRQLTTFKATPSGLGLDQVESKLRQLAGDLDRQEALDFGADDDGGKANPNPKHQP